MFECNSCGSNYENLGDTSYEKVVDGLMVFNCDDCGGRVETLDYPVD